MTITLGGSRPLATTTATLDAVIDVKNPIENDTTNTIVFPLCLNNVAPVPATFVTAGNCTYTTGSTTITTTGGGFSNVRVGDRLESTAQAGDFTTQIVASKGLDNNTIVVSAVPDAALGSGGTITFTPPTTDHTLFLLQVELTQVGSVVTFTAKGYPVTGAQSIDTDGDGDTSDNVNIASLTPLSQVISLTVDLDTFLAAARVARS